MRSRLAAHLSMAAILAAHPATAGTQQPRGPAQEIALKEALVIGPVGSTARSPFHTDAVEAMIVDGSWKTPAAGDTVTLPDGKTKTWKAAAPADDGWLRLPPGGYALWRVETDTERVMVLEASGHGMVYVDGVPRTGDPYEYGYVRIPVQLKGGASELLFRAGRGRMRARLVAPSATVILGTADSTLPDLVSGEEDTPILGAVVVINATTETRTDLLISVEGGWHRATVATVPALPPLSVRKVAFHSPWEEEPGQSEVELTLTLSGGQKGENVLDSTHLKLPVRQPLETRKCTFISGIDGSVQYYSVVPAHPKDGDTATPGLVLSLHGASVEATSQANAYQPKDWCHIVCPTNRRPFGFDWEDWGRLDALEVLADAAARLHTDPQRVFLTGHSMGGHGTWNMGVQFPDRFAAIAPSAGWVSFWSYAGMPHLDTSDPVLALLDRAHSPCDTLALSRNLVNNGVYVLHGDADDNVPVEQARAMREHLGTFHPDFAYHEQPGAGHWWGNACVDWPPLFQFLHDRSLPKRADVRRVAFKTASPAVSSACHWARILQQTRAMAPSSIELAADRDARRISGTTDNVSLLELDVDALPGDAQALVKVDLDGQSLDAVPTPRSGDEAGGQHVILRRDGQAWSTNPAWRPKEKLPGRCGPFKAAFTDRMVFVYGTRGTPEENAWSLAKARFDAETFWYRGNGSIDTLSDVEFGRASNDMRDRNVILYGNADTNSAWEPLLADSPIQVRREGISVGDKRAAADDVACVFIRPRPGSERASVGVVAGTGPSGLRLTDRLPYFISGVAFPDWTVFTPAMLQAGAPGIGACGFFASDWSIDPAQSAWRE